MDRQVKRSAKRAPVASAAPVRKGISRRNVVRLGVLGAATAATVGAIGHYARRQSRVASPAEVFKNDGPDARTWELWQQRGWVREAQHYLKLGRNVQCRICPNECVLEPNDRSRCRNKVAREGQLFTMAYGNPCALHVDPIEKKPLFHFLPGTRAFSLATSGCSLRCLNCQNWEISQKTPEETKSAAGPELRLGRGTLRPGGRDDMERASLFPEDVVRAAAATGCHSVAYTYSEPTSFYEYMLESAKLARRAGIKNVWVTNGYINQEPLEELCRYLDGANVDLKSFSEQIYATLNSGKLRPILDGLVKLRERGVWFEVTNLVVPRYTDDLGMFQRMCDWMVASLGPDTPLHISRFHPEYKLDHLSATPIQTLTQAREIAQRAGLHYVYIGNVRGVAHAATTFCPRCRKPIVERDIYAVQTNQLSGGKCAHCGEKIAGVWTA
jgi:pyruvate formate lyase activating enzyme